MYGEPGQKLQVVEEMKNGKERRPLERQRVMREREGYIKYVRSKLPGHSTLYYKLLRTQ